MNGLPPYNELMPDCGITGQVFRSRPDRSKFIPNDAPIVSRDSFSTFYRDFRMSYECMLEIRKLEAERDKAEHIIKMIQDNTKMPHRHQDPQLRLYCLAEIANEYFEVT